MPRWVLAPAIAFGFLIFIVSISVFAAQKSLPGETLYSLKRLSENVTVSLDPDFKNEMLVRRSREIKDLVEGEKDERLIESAIKDYKQELKRGKHDAAKLEQSERLLEKTKEKLEEKTRKHLEKELEDGKGKNSDDSGDKDDGRVKGKEEEFDKNE